MNGVNTEQVKTFIRAFNIEHTQLNERARLALLSSLGNISTPKQNSAK